MLNLSSMAVGPLIQARQAPILGLILIGVPIPSRHGRSISILLAAMRWHSGVLAILCCFRGGCLPGAMRRTNALKKCWPKASLCLLILPIGSFITAVLSIQCAMRQLAQQGPPLLHAWMLIPR